MLLCPMLGDARFDHLTKVGYTTFPHYEEIFFPLYLLSDLWEILCSESPMKYYLKIFRSLSDLYLNQLLQNTDSLTLSFLLCFLVVILL